MIEPKHSSVIEFAAFCRIASEGWQADRDGLGLDANPYHITARAHHDWRQGWISSAAHACAAAYAKRQREGKP